MALKQETNNKNNTKVYPTLARKFNLNKTKELLTFRSVLETLDQN